MIKTNNDRNVIPINEPLAEWDKLRREREQAAWVRCEDCDDFICTLHDMHAYDCSCPAIEEWAEVLDDPYIPYFAPVKTDK
jgi:hypothetical protein